MTAPESPDGMRLRVKDLEEQVRQMRSAGVLASNELLDPRDIDTGCNSTRLGERAVRPRSWHGEGRQHEGGLSAVQAVILAAGCGSRLQHAIGGRPKCLAEIGDERLILNQLDQLARAGVTDVCVVTGYRADEVRAAVGARARFVHNPLWSESNSLYSLSLCRQVVSRSMLVLNCDVLFDDDVLRRLLACGSNSFAYDSSSGTEDEHMKVAFDGAFLESMSKSMPKERSVGENVGMLFFDKRAARLLFREADLLLAAGQAKAWLACAVEEAARYIALLGVDIADLPWIEIDTPEDLHRARREVWPRIALGREFTTDRAADRRAASRRPSTNGVHSQFLPLSEPES